LRLLTAGLVEEVGEDVKKLHKGQRVAVSFCIVCGECEYCKRGLWTSCETTNNSLVWHTDPNKFFDYQISMLYKDQEWSNSVKTERLKHYEGRRLCVIRSLIYAVR
jgi:Zn-dependent alcohol dehydrogenase